MSAESGSPAPIGNRRLFWACVVVGWALIVVGIRGVFVDARFTRPPQWIAWFVGAAVFHDLVIAPLVFAVGGRWLRRLRGLARAPVQAAMILTGLLAAVSFPVVLRLGRTGDNATLLPHNAGAGFLVLVGVIWTLTAGLTLIVLRRTYRRPE